MKLSSLRAKARRNTLEVEHILAVAKARLPGLRDELNRLSDECSWSRSPYLPDGTHVVPLAKWADIAGVYADDGIEALGVLAAELDNAVYVIGLLEELRSHAAVNALIAFFPVVMQAPEHALETAWRLTTAYNSLLSFKDGVVATDEQATAVRSFLMRLLPLATTEHQTCLLFCALRGVGDTSSLDFLASHRDLAPPNETIRMTAMRAIRQRLRNTR
ncbi:hypothetical protein AB6D34_06970 [Pectobacterium brasiliense]|uniref:Uncharacterized protein n=1 Tax=Pectobacterium brasiliense TaxID=180957 RepID=A0A433NI42_9GAMM|nr:MULTISPECIES: hypothetical protein [Pectobacterium]GKW28250.1 hypothetical protein PEC331060_14280 [Pectobacterium carotovorum subsp. carotovorum]MBN3046975.1 hypothetical protein [Pectobacterium brasiliense]MBN3074890.1 hypothetical protein [Pectobacterium brasiliense]MBN3083983.1 hypothetical protein [Pectobacterium brasiliense]MBN3089523.1 hypothetical protein [Pectobacterium brasiliense]